MIEGRASRTAMMVAYWRAAADAGVTTVPGFSDPAARKLLSGWFWEWMLRRLDRLVARGRRPADEGFVQAVDGITARVSYIDAAIADAGNPQVVILGAGLDTRAWRLEALRNRRVFEVDHPATQAYKLARVPDLGPALASVTFVAVDFTKDDLTTSLLDAGFDPAVPTTWAWEGVTMYLDDAALRSTLGVIRRCSAPGSVLVVHYHEPEGSRFAAFMRRILFGWLGEAQVGLRSRAVMTEELAAAGFAVTTDGGIDAQLARVGATGSAHRRSLVSRIAIAVPTT
jgi:methyltransferase (TIGR00027 family)